MIPTRWLIRRISDGKAIPQFPVCLAVGRRKLLDSGPTSAAGRLNKNASTRQILKIGASGNPAGRPPGARHKTTIALEAHLDGRAQRLTEIAVEVAMAAPPTSMISPPT
jgi:hypothetical protein